VSFATRAGQVAAAEIFMLLEGVDQLHAIAWHRSGILFMPVSHLQDQLDKIEAELSALGAYICDKRTKDGERLRNHAGNLHMSSDDNWEGVGLATQMAYRLFAETCLSVYEALDLVQAAERAARKIEAAPENPPLKREDSIFEEQESLGDLIPGVLEQLAASDAQRTREAAHAEGLSRRRKRDAQLQGEGWETKRAPKAGRPMSIGAPETD